PHAYAHPRSTPLSSPSPFCLPTSLPHLHPHSFPTRRSSDLTLSSASDRRVHEGSRIRLRPHAENGGIWVHERLGGRNLSCGTRGALSRGARTDRQGCAAMR